MTEYSAVAVASSRLQLLGGWQLLVDGAEVELGHREQRLVALLALADHSARAQVASALWPDSTDERALASLRRAVLHCQKRCPGLLEAARLTIALAPGVRVDVDDLRRAAGLTGLPMTDLVAHELMTALRGGELLPGWYDDWAVEERGLLEQLRAEGLERVAVHGLEQGDAVLAVDAARAASEIEPLRELPREVSIRAHLSRGDAAGALHEFQHYCTVMHDELGAAPSRRLVELVEPLLEAPQQTSPVTIPRQRVAPSEEQAVDDPVQDWAPTSLDDFLDGQHRGAATGVRRVAAALVAVAGVALTVSLAVAVAGPDLPADVTSDPGGTVPADRVPSPGAVAPGRTVRVLPIDADTGAAAFAVRANQRPAQVRLVVRGPAGLRVVRHLVVRDAGGRDVVVRGLDPGTYTWSATSATASPVSGQVSVSTPAAEAREQDVASATVTPDVTQVASTPSQAPLPEQTPSSSPSSTPTSSPTPSPTPDPSPTPSPSPSHSPTGTPQDPGTVAPTPVG
ncbi:DNA-binding transcriptional activator of the SARP family [Nocardioides alpinus]|uniref:DNA-binding transcriptional activator of the SARP family n=1 Tax=Nocardioides alpinus TaxID=748909 RepID=A0A1I0WKN9_9ACTN|nr:BTAD domain-containing putative transcriptional regulator [Nocardioides alpinus]PKH37966.1 hypothetical protein CXG46_21565 [Nocardioides alpinus]SFA88788.1 DNA-binding transcriptional activator of the SARP family [Nocardioides alpinus]